MPTLLIRYGLCLLGVPPKIKTMDTGDAALSKGEGRSVWLLGDLYTFKLTGEALSVTELTAFPQNGLPPHIHLRCRHKAGTKSPVLAAGRT